MRATPGLGLAALCFATAARPAAVAGGNGPDAPPVANEQQEESAWAKLQDLMQITKELGDWEDNARNINQAIDNMWERNRWDSEADRFARHVASRVSAIPPWDMPARMEAITEMVGERYGLAPEQSERLEACLWSETLGLVLSQGPIMLAQAREAVNLRKAGKPFTADKIAEWTRQSDPIMADMRRRVDRIVKNMSDTLDDRQREILKRDRASLERRMEYVDRMREDWADGKWSPEDWGLEHDAIQRRSPGAPPGPPAADSRWGRFARRSVSGYGALPYDEDTWERYVRWLIRHYEFDASQEAAAISILRELQSRARDYLAAHEDEIADSPRRRRANDPRFEPIAALFEELKSRLDIIPTDAQRERAGP